MNIKKYYIIGLLILSVFLISCGNEKTKEEKEFVKVQKIYDKKGIDGFCKYLDKNKYIAVKDASQDDATPILIAIKNGDIDKVKLFLETGASPEEKDSKGKDLIDYVFENSNSEVIDFAVSKMPFFTGINQIQKAICLL